MPNIGTYVEAYKGFVYNYNDDLADIQTAFNPIYADASHLSLQKQSNRELWGLDSNNHIIFSVNDGQVLSVQQGSQEIWSWDPSDVTTVGGDLTANIQLSVSGTADISPA